ncbi:hypothetical protein H072_7607 [Dactylellina haptotyla CBS 200.50]|uniref:CBM1 domain-containing protein n=1 Tax=Dactylellina haptotyla (strain CBS 200.50) TaxID=1284197 RepID=S8BTP6_DACHA|nr:hypothetical protein H072_7607 [Dactylellina haptotyla CBS 200.50]
MVKLAALASIAGLAGGVVAQSAVYGQCGGIGWTGPTTCVSGSTCVYSNDYYSQCIPSTQVTTTTSKTTTKATTTSSTTTLKTTTTTTKTTTAAASTSAASSFILAGDSTVTNDKGWGGAFCSQVSAKTCTNFAHSGTTTVTFKSLGDWAKLITAVKAASKPCYVLIQFGHNDQKVLTTSEFQNNLQNMGKEIQAISGAYPVFVTSLSRRGFSSGKVSDSLEAWMVYTRAAANAIGAKYIELLQISIAYLNGIGETAAHKMDYESGDSTHLNACGAKVFARMVGDLLVRKPVVAQASIKTDSSLTSSIDNKKSVC